MSVDTPVNMPSEDRSTCRLIIGRHVDRVSADMSTDMSVDTRPRGTVGSRPTGALSAHDSEIISVSCFKKAMLLLSKVVAWIYPYFFYFFEKGESML